MITRRGIAVPAAFLFWTVYLTALQTMADAARTNKVDDAAKRSAYENRALAKPVLLRNAEVMGVKLPFSPATVIISVIAAILLFRAFNQNVTATASHVLLDDHSDAARDRLAKLKGDIGNDPTKFADCARKYSKCPSGKSAGGSLGSFGQGNMVPPFDRAVFDPKTKVGVVQGPVHTQFGWHLILVTERDEVRHYAA